MILFYTLSSTVNENSKIPVLLWQTQGRKRNLLNRRRAEDKHENFTFKASLFLSKKSNFSWAQKGSSSKEGATRKIFRIVKKWKRKDGSLLLWRENFAWRGKSSSSPKKTISCPGMPKPPGQWRAGITPGFFSDFSLQDFSQDFPTQHSQALWRCYNFTQDLCTPGSCSGGFLQTLLIWHIQDENKWWEEKLWWADCRIVPHPWWSHRTFNTFPKHEANKAEFPPKICPGRRMALPRPQGWHCCWHRDQNKYYNKKRASDVSFRKFFT